MRTKGLKSYPEDRSITAMGIVIPVQWDVQGNPIRMALSTVDEHEYIIDRRSRLGREVANLLRKQVKVLGILNEKGSITVKHFECIDYGSTTTQSHVSEPIISLSLNPKES